MNYDSKGHHEIDRLRAELAALRSERDALQADADARLGDPRDIPADTGHREADRLICRLVSDDPDFQDCTDAVVLIRRLIADSKAPDEFATWKDAAVDERMKRVAAGAERDTLRAENERLRAEKVSQCGHPSSLMLRSAETGKALYCELCDERKRRRDAESMEEHYKARAEKAEAERDEAKFKQESVSKRLHAVNEICEARFVVLRNSRGELRKAETERNALRAAVADIEMHTPHNYWCSAMIYLKSDERPIEERCNCFKAKLRAVLKEYE